MSKFIDVSHKFTPIYVLLIVFILSVVLRLPYINNQNPTFATAHSVIIEQIWYQTEQMHEQHHFWLKGTFPFRGNQFIDGDIIGALTDKIGNRYYISYPPLGFIAPYVFFKVLHMYPDVVPFKIFNLVCQFTSALFVYLITNFILRHQHAKAVLRHGTSLTAGILYLLCTEVLLFQMDYYFSVIFVITEFIIGIYIALQFFESSRKQVGDYLLLGLIIAAMVYTEWLGIFFAISVLAYGFLFKKLDWKLIFTLIISCSLPCIAMIWQYSSIAGLNAFLLVALQRYLLRSGLASNVIGQKITALNLMPWLHILWYFLLGYFPQLVLITGLLIWLKQRQMLASVLKQPFFLKLVVLALLPCILYGIVFFQYTSFHIFSVLDMAAFLMITIGILLYHQLKSSTNSQVSWRLKTSILLSVMTSCSIFYALQYYYHTDKNHPHFDVIGIPIAQTAKSDEVIFLQLTHNDVYNDRLVNPSLLYYTRRNVQRWQGNHLAELVIRKNGLHKGILFTLTPDGKQIESYRRFRVD